MTQQEINHERAILGDADGGLQRSVVRSDYYRGQINLKSFRAQCPHLTVLSSDPLVIEPERDRFVILSKFGGVAFWNCPDSLVNDIHAELHKLPGVLERQDRIQDELEVVVGGLEDRVTFNEVRLKDLSVEKLKIIARGLNQSVALDFFEGEVLAAFQKLNAVITTLRESGRIHMKEKEILKTVGFALEVRAAVLANLTLFDDPPETWESEGLARLHGMLFDHFDLAERLSAINQKVDFLTDVDDILMDVLTNRKSHRLEWIIIILIFIEIVFFAYIEVLP